MIELKPSSPVPLYLQIRDEIRRLIAIGALAHGDRLPTIRELAVRARVNRNTAARAIRQLESEGLVRTRVGQGTFVERQLPGERRARQQAALDRAIDRLLDEARTLGVEPDELRRRLERRLKATSETRQRHDESPLPVGEEE